MESYAGFYFARWCGKLKLPMEIALIDRGISPLPVSVEAVRQFLQLSKAHKKNMVRKALFGWKAVPKD